MDKTPVPGPGRLRTAGPHPSQTSSNALPRRAFLSGALAACGAALAGPLVSRGVASVPGLGRDYPIRIIDLVRESTVVDMLAFLTTDWDKLERWQSQQGSFAQEDFDRIKSSGVTVFHPAVSYPAPDPHSVATRCFRNWNKFLKFQSGHFVRINRFSELLEVKKNGKIGVLLGMQDSSHFRNLEDVDDFFRLGQRVSQLTYNSRNALGTGCGDPIDDGLTRFGAAVIRRMESLGMAVDLSHCGPRTTIEALEAASKPILITHSNCKTLVPGEARCKSDEALTKMAATGGVLGITAVRKFTSSRQTVTTEDVLDHFDYAIRLVGVEHVGLGSDADLEGNQRFIVNGLNRPGRIFDIAHGLSRRGYGASDIRLLLGGNFQRVLNQIDRVQAPLFVPSSEFTAGPICAGI
jgi:membrane dipeptidase